MATVTETIQTQISHLISGNEIYDRSKAENSENPYRLRGMATYPKFRRKGHGKKLMKESNETENIFFISFHSF